MTDRSEQVPINNLEGMPQPEEYLWDIEDEEESYESDDLYEDNNELFIDDQVEPISEDLGLGLDEEDDFDIGNPPSMDDLPAVDNTLFGDSEESEPIEEEEVKPIKKSKGFGIARKKEKVEPSSIETGERVTKRKLKKVIPNQTGSGPYAKLEKPLTPQQQKKLRQKIKKQPIYYKKSKSYESRSRFAQTWGWVLGLAFSLLIIVANGMAYLKTLQESPQTNEIPNSVAKYVPGGIEALYMEHNIGDLVVIFGAVALFFLGIIATGLTVVYLLRTVVGMISGFGNLLPMLAFGFASSIAWKAIISQTLHPWSAILVILGALLVGKILDKLAVILKIG